jgi:hypothetical protein
MVRRPSRFVTNLDLGAPVVLAACRSMADPIGSALIHGIDLRELRPIAYQDAPTEHEALATLEGSHRTPR